MTGHFQRPKCRVVKLILCLTLTVVGLKATCAEAQQPRKLFCNLDADNFFGGRPLIPDGLASPDLLPFPKGGAGERIDRYVDAFADAGATVLLCGTNYRRTNYRSRVWDSFWDGYDPSGPDDQPFLAPALAEGGEMPEYRVYVANMLAVHEQGIDYPARVLQRCRHRGISPWISLRMNDCHFNFIPNHPFNGTFGRRNPQFFRKNSPGYYANCFDYAHQEVRDYFRALIVETLERYDFDGLELDFMREPYLFSLGKEAEGGTILTGWLREVHKLVADAAVKRGHPICLGVRVPSHPETSLAMGLDAITWAKEGLIDLLVVTPRWATVEFDMPIQKWRKMLGTSNVTLAGGLEMLYRPYPNGPGIPITPELSRGAAVSVLSRGADAVYTFNYFPVGYLPLPVYQENLKAMGSLDSLLKLPRCFGITFRDITAPGENYQAPLPATGKELVFPMNLGPSADNRGPGDLLIELAPSQGVAAPVPTVSVDGKPCEVRNDDKRKDGVRAISFSVPVVALAGTEDHMIKVTSKDQSPVTIQRVEVLLK